MSFDQLNEMELPQRSVYPPSFCQWRLMLAVIAVTQISVFLLAIGHLQGLSLGWIGMMSLYAQALALVSASGICIAKAWLNRLSFRDAWLGAWLVAVLTATAFSYFAGVIGTVLGVGPGQLQLSLFMTQSILAVALVTVALLRYLYIRAQQRSQLVAQSEARVQALQARIRPHFLFNSLNTIASLIPDDPIAAERATEDLADLFRGSMQRADHMISLSDELSLAEKYLQMEQRRLGERLRIDWQIDDLPDGASVLPLTLQPLLENAVIHGIQSRTEGGEIRLFGRSENDMVVITIVNPLGLEKTTNRGHGMALGNIRERLSLAFGIKASLITHRTEEEFFAVLSLPFIEFSDAEHTYS
jgi:two-component system sensor histidine kinase AlgZ